LVFIDECGSNIALTRLYARSPKGKRAYGAIPRNRRANITLLASLSLQGMGEALILEGSADAPVFELYIEQILAPSLQAGQIVILDNLSTHIGEKVRQAIEARGCQLLFLPSYSPDFSPIEEAFSKLKTCLRRVGARTQEALRGARLGKRCLQSPSKMLLAGLRIAVISQNKPTARLGKIEHEALARV
jgi:transposase